MKNFGVLFGERSTDYRAGLVGGSLPYEVRSSGNWEAFLPIEEKQFNDNGDSMSCVTFAELSGIEMQEIYHDGIQSNYSDRWIAKMSGTTPQGNYLWKVADAIREFGLVKETSYPAPQAPWTWADYHADIPEPLLSQLKAEGQEWLKKWDVKYEWVEVSKESLMKHLKHAPLTVVIPGHAVMNFKTTAELIHFFDTYPPHKKTTPSVQSALKLVLYKRDKAVPDNHLLVDIHYLDSGKQVQKLREALIKLGWGFHRKNGYAVDDVKDWPDVLDDRLAGRVLDYQKGNFSHMSIAFWKAFFNRGRIVDADTRDVINNGLTLWNQRNSV